MVEIEDEQPAVGKQFAIGTFRGDNSRTIAW